jgi:hypothetical protein
VDQLLVYDLFWRLDIILRPRCKIDSSFTISETYTNIAPQRKQQEEPRQQPHLQQPPRLALEQNALDSLTLRSETLIIPKLRLLLKRPQPPNVHVHLKPERHIILKLKLPQKQQLARLPLLQLPLLQRPAPLLRSVLALLMLRRDFLITPRLKLPQRRRLQAVKV